MKNYSNLSLSLSLSLSLFLTSHSYPFQQNGLRLSFDTLDKLGLGDVRVRLFELIKKSRELKLDYNEYMCLKFLILLNPGKSLCSCLFHSRIVLYLLQQ